MEDQIFYTLQIHYRSMKGAYAGGRPDFPILIEERKDCYCDWLRMTESEWRKQIRSSIFTIGFEVPTGTGSFEFIHPNRIIEVFLLKQDKKFAL